MEPPPWAVMCGITALQHKNVLVTLRAKALSHVSRLISSVALRPRIPPALVTRISMPPRNWTVSLTTAFTAVSSVKSALIASALTPCAWAAATVSCAPASLDKYVSATCTPWAASASTIPRPIPDAPPVTRAR